MAALLNGGEGRGEAGRADDRGDDEVALDGADVGRLGGILSGVQASL